MKTSKIILVSYLSLIGLFFLSFVITTDRSESSSYWNIEQREEKMSEIRHVQMNGQGRLEIKKANSSRMEIWYHKDSTQRPLPYRISGDTLIMEGYEHFRYYTQFTLYANKIDRVETNGGNIFLSLQQDSIMIDGQNKGAEIHIRENSEIGNINVGLKDHASLHIHESAINRMDIITDNSYVNCNVPIKDVALKATNQSVVHLRDVNNLQSERDETSGLYLR